MKSYHFLALVVVIALSAPLISFAQEQKPGQPLYFDPEKHGGHQSDLQPEQDPYFQQEKAKRERKGQSMDDLYHEDTHTIREEKLYFRRVDKTKETKETKGTKEAEKSPSRWDQ